jgi:hypothetical protein
VVALVGEPGGGKSRLVYEFVHSHHTQGWRVLEYLGVHGKSHVASSALTCSSRYAHIEERDGTHPPGQGHRTGADAGRGLPADHPGTAALLDVVPDDSPFSTT